MRFPSIFVDQPFIPGAQPAPPPPTIHDYLAKLSITPEQAQAEYDKLVPTPSNVTALVSLEAWPKNVSPTSLAATDQKLRDVYKIVAENGVVINIHETIAKAGFDNHHLPKLAYAKASELKVSALRNADDGRIRFWLTESGSVHTAFYDYYHEQFQDGRAESVQATAVIPIVPKGMRPDQLEEFDVLFEPVWNQVRRTFRTPAVRVVDPILIKKVAGAFYRIIAYWDVSPIEAEVLKGLI